MNFVSFSVFLQPFLAAPAGQTLELTVLLSESKCSIHLHTQSNVRITKLTFVSLATKTGNERRKPAPDSINNTWRQRRRFFSFFFLLDNFLCDPNLSLFFSHRSPRRQLSVDASGGINRWYPWVLLLLPWAARGCVAWCTRWGRTRSK